MYKNLFSFILVLSFDIVVDLLKRNVVARARSRLIGVWDAFHDFLQAISGGLLGLTLFAVFDKKFISSDIA